MGVKKDIKMLLLENDITITDIAKEMTKRTGKFFSRSNISQKLLRGTLKYEEAQLIGEILGYELKFIRTKPYI
ncbi:LLM class flavin-dependent oxidoreductase [bacterium]|nr:LLM class flavin-dependent oxidoreductase [bacterium]